MLQTKRDGMLVACASGSLVVDGGQQQVDKGWAEGTTASCEQNLTSQLS